MICDIKTKYCPVCAENTDHMQGNFRSKRINGELYHLESSSTESLKKLSQGFNEYVIEKQGGIMNGTSPEEYAKTSQAGLNFEELFAPQVRSLKCCQCQHLIKISRLP